MKAAVLRSARDIRVEEVPLPSVGPEDLLVKVRICGICTGELMDWYVERKAPYTPGHEFVGTVAKVGERVEGFSVGERVVVHHHAPCMECDHCRFGDYVHCPVWRRGGVEPGGFAEYVRVPKHIWKVDVLKVPSHVSDEDAALVEPLATSVKAVRRAQIVKGEPVLMVGLGFMGLLNYEVATLFGGDVWGVDINPRRVEMARERWGIRAHLPEELEGRRFRKVFVNPGTPSAVLSGLDFVKPGGSVILFAPLPPGRNVPLDFNRLYFDEITLIPSYSAGPDDTRLALRIISEGSVRPSKFVSARVPLSEISRGFDLARHPDVIKVMVRISEDGD
ncbi:MAG: alcohol dehydrogenase catalytic domain-containing protein [Thermotogae bacterium]|nr:alcohol dehydrogenase catalytic domain-containing protein [Thermotogota bacterium]